MTSARQNTEVFEDLFEVNDLISKIEDRGETGGPINSELLGRVLLRAGEVVKREPVQDEKDALIVEAVSMYYDAKANQMTINMPSSLLSELVQICSVEAPSPLQLHEL